jgi:hypothetical protein
MLTRPMSPVAGTAGIRRYGRPQCPPLAQRVPLTKSATTGATQSELGGQAGRRGLACCLQHGRLVALDGNYPPGEPGCHGPAAPDGGPTTGRPTLDLGCVGLHMEWAGSAGHWLDWRRRSQARSCWCRKRTRLARPPRSPWSADYGANLHASRSLTVGSYVSNFHAALPRRTRVMHISSHTLTGNLDRNLPKPR